MKMDITDVITTPLDAFNILKSAPVAFTGGSANTRGALVGSSNPLKLFEVTGDVLLRIFGVCTVDLVSAGGGTLEVGVANNTAVLIAQTTATAIDVNELWNDASPAIGDTLANIAGPFLVVNGNHIYETVGTANITAGQLYYICLWRPLSPDGCVEAIF